MATDLFQRAWADYRAGRPERAAALLVEHVRQRPRDGAARNLFAVVLIMLGRAPEAIEHARRATALAPTDPECATNLGNALAISGRHEEAVQVFTRVTGLAPKFGGAWCGLGQSLLELKRWARAEKALGRAIELCPGVAQVVEGRMWSLLQLGRAGEGVEIGKQALAAGCEDVNVLNRLCVCALHAGTPGEEELAAIHRRLGRRLAEGVGRMDERPLTPDDAARPLRVGYLSADVYRHSVMYFFESLLQHRDRERHLAFVYSSTPQEDYVSMRVRMRVDGFVHCRGVPDRALAGKIRQDAIDVLVDLGGHYADSRAVVCSTRAAPLTMTWLGYPHSTGLEGMDVRVVDERTDPPGSEEDQFATERLVRLPECFLCYRPEEKAPGVAPLAEGPITFGCFNAAAKWTDRALSLWRGVLDRVPGSRLICKTYVLRDEEVRGSFRERLRKAGLGDDRVELAVPPVDVREHLATYGRIHVALDTFPYHGTTTTCEALWMGVPVVTLAGNSHASRVGVSLLNCVGLGEFVAKSDEEYAGIAARLAQDTPRLRSLREGMRDRLLASPLLDGPGFARRFEAMMRGEWRRRCERGA